jgi:hypothetical protein
MRLAYGTESICVWFFPLRRPAGSPGPDDNWRAGLNALVSACRALGPMELVTSPVHVSSFFGVGPSYPAPQERLVAVGDLLGQMEELVTLGGRQDGRIRVDGRAKVLGGDEDRLLEGVIELECVVSADDIYLTLSTWSDIWMPYNLMAQSQWEVAELNAPRLRAALEAIEQIVGKPGYAEDSRFAKVDGYELRNHIVRGDVLDLQDMGYDESWIVERWPEPDPPDPPPGPAGA